MKTPSAGRNSTRFWASSLETTGDAATDATLENEQVTLVSFSEDARNTFGDMLQSMNYVVLILIFCAGMLAFIVLYNLTNINITERQREIATIKVLGFYDREVSMYVYRETLMLTLLGCLTGLLLGIVLHIFVINTVEVDMVMFGRSIKTPELCLVLPADHAVLRAGQSGDGAEAAENQHGGIPEIRGLGAI